MILLSLKNITYIFIHTYIFHLIGVKKTHALSLALVTFLIMTFAHGFKITKGFIPSVLFQVDSVTPSCVWVCVCVCVSVCVWGPQCLFRLTLLRNHLSHRTWPGWVLTSRVFIRRAPLQRDGRCVQRSAYPGNDPPPPQRPPPPHPRLPPTPSR